MAKINAGVYHGGEVNAWDAHVSELGKVSAGYALLSIEEGWAQLSAKKHNGWLAFCLHCEECLAMTGRIVIIPVGNTAYLSSHRNSQAWYSQSFITGFVGLVHHDAHMLVPPFKNPKNRIMLVARTSYLPPKTPHDLLDHGDATHLVSVAYDKSHHREVIVYNGLRMSIDSWAKQIIGTIKLFGFKSHNAKCHQAKRDMTMALDFDDSSPWMVQLDRSYRQSDGINCGPIACLKVMELYGFLKEGSIERIGESPSGIDML